MRAIRGGIADSIGATFEAPVVTEFKLQKKIQELEQQLQQAHRAGWEQAKREAVDHLRYQHNLVVGEASLDYLATLEQCWNAIASMEYKGAAND